MSRNLEVEREMRSLYSLHKQTVDVLARTARTRLVVTENSELAETMSAHIVRRRVAGQMSSLVLTEALSAADGADEQAQGMAKLSTDMEVFAGRIVDLARTHFEQNQGFYWAAAEADDAARNSW